MPFMMLPNGFAVILFSLYSRLIKVIVT